MVGEEWGSNIQSSRFNLVSVVDVGGRAGPEGSEMAEEVIFKLSAVGIVVAKGYRKG
jgi:hypothetical protein